MAYLPNTEFTYKDSPNLDAFGRLRVSNLHTIFDVKFINDSASLFFNTVATGGTLTRITGESSNYLTVSAGAGNYVITQSKRYFNYQSGKSQLALFTGVMSKQANVTKRIGLFNSGTAVPYTPVNGLFFEADGTDVSINVLKNTTGSTKVIQSAWNLDKFDGTGPSKITLDFTKSQIFVIDFEWLGVGRVRFGFNIDGITYYCHQVLNANAITGVYIANPNLPIRYEIRSTGGAGTLVQICSSISSEGGVEPNGIIRNIKTNLAGLQINSNLTKPILAIRLKSTDRFIQVIPELIAFADENNGDFFYILKMYDGNETISRNGVSTQWTNIVFTGLTNSAVEQKNNFLVTDLVVAGQGMEIGSGIVINTGGGSINIDAKNALLIGSKLNGVRDVLVLEIQNFGAADTYHAALNWREL